MRIHVIGNSGSGKTYLARKLSQKTGTPYTELDDFQWDGSGYGKRRDQGERRKLLEAAVAREDWILEGVYYDWCGASFERADRIILLETPLRVCRRRIVVRFVRRKLGIEKGKNESFRSLIDLLRWTEHFHDDNLERIKERLADYAGKTVTLHKKKDVKRFLEKF